MLRILFFFLFVSDVSANDYCEIDNIFNKSIEGGSCQKGQRLFGYHHFNSENRQFEYEFNKKFNIYLLKL
mgnify:FL=1